MAEEKLPSGKHFDLKGKKAERVVQELAERSFLIDWCFPSPRRANGKEICDLLVVFDDIAIIWQIKNLKARKDGEYKQAEVEKNLRQIAGARRQLFGLRVSVKLKNDRRTILFDPSSITRVFLVSVMLGDGDAITSLVEDCDDEKIHCFDRAFTEIVLSELDTIRDFTQYLTMKEEFLSHLKMINVIGGEQQLLALYLRGNRTFAECGDANCIMVDDGIWEQLIRTPRFRAKKEADRISYVWDSIIDRAHGGSSQYERVAREMARATRFGRRSLGRIFFDAHQKAHSRRESADQFRRMLNAVEDNTTYCFLFQSEKHPRALRAKYLESMCTLARSEFSENPRVIGIATEMAIRPTCSYDYCFLHLPELLDEDVARAKKWKAENAFFVNPTYFREHDNEYPSVRRKAKRKPAPRTKKGQSPEDSAP